MSTLGAAGMLTVGLGATTMIGAQQGNEMSKHLKENAPAVAAEYVNEDEPKSFLGYSYTEIDPGKQQEALEDKTHPDHAQIKESYNHGSRQALRLTAIVPALMGVGFLALLLYYKSQGGYKVITLDGGSDESDNYPSDNYPSEDSVSDEPAAEEADADEGGDTDEAAGEE